jgi:hypothetical protein
MAVGGGVAVILVVAGAVFSMQVEGPAPVDAVALITSQTRLS